MRTVRNHRGFTLIEVMIAAAILAVGLLALVSAFPIGYVDVTASGGQSKATAYAQQMLEQLKNQPFTVAANGNDAPDPVDPTYNRTWTITQEPGTNPPNRLARITVTVTWGGPRLQTVTLETMRAE
ncbi:MAG: prepilin-type N-terminal cleavage/methylation domain-containing protein [Candidatus Methylomirabilales bacterium]